jgi:hypothetical protein
MIVLRRTGPRPVLRAGSRFFDQFNFNHLRSLVAQLSKLRATGDESGPVRWGPDPHMKFQICQYRKRTHVYEHEPSTL